MRRGLFIFGICALGWLGCDSMQEVSLYEVDLTPTPEQLVSSYPYRHVYLDSCNSNLFGHRSHPFDCMATRGQLPLARSGISLGQLRGEEFEKLGANRSVAVSDSTRLRFGEQNPHVFLFGGLRGTSGHLQNQPVECGGAEIG